MSEDLTLEDLKESPLWQHLPLRVAARFDDEGGLLWTTAMPAVLENYSISPDAYWNLTVAEVALLVTNLADADPNDG